MGGGLDLLDKTTDHFFHYQHDSTNNKTLGDDRILCMEEDKGGQLWIGTASGLDRLNPGNGYFTHLDNPAITNRSGNTINAIRQDRQGNLWLGTEDDGLYLYDPQQKTFTRFSHSDKDPSSLGNNMIKCMLVDQKGRLWAGGINGGLNLFNAPKSSFFRYEYEPGNNASLSQRTVSALFEDRQGNLWVGTHRAASISTPPARKNSGSTGRIPPPTALAIMM